LKSFKDLNPRYAGINFKASRDDEVLGESLLKMELQLMVKGHKFGVLLVKDKQKADDQYFQNRSI